MSREASRRAGRPRIGITTYAPEVGDDGRDRYHLPTPYVQGVREAGGLALLLPPGDGEAGELLDLLDGLILCGGGDLDPRLPGAAAHPSNYSTSLERDRFELALVRGALEHSLPLLAICRGMQVLNVALGGDLHPHLPDLVGDAVTHRRSQQEPARHPVKLLAGSQLERVLGTDRIEVASWHHQGVARLGRGVRACAWAADGTVEAIELEGRPEVLAVQWHPELELGPGSRQQQLFTALVESARARIRRR